MQSLRETVRVYLVPSVSIGEEVFNHKCLIYDAKSK